MIFKRVDRWKDTHFISGFIRVFVWFFFPEAWQHPSCIAFCTLYWGKKYLDCLWKWDYFVNGNKTDMNKSKKAQYRKNVREFLNISKQISENILNMMILTGLPLN